MGISGEQEWALPGVKMATLVFRPEETMVREDLSEDISGVPWLES